MLRGVRGCGLQVRQMCESETERGLVCAWQWLARHLLPA
jgi:hypothetical protein